MDFGLPDDQRESTHRKRAARGARNPTGCASMPRPEPLTRTVGGAVRARLARYRRVRGRTAARDSGAIELSILCEELGRVLAPSVPADGARGDVIEHAGSAAQRERWLPGLASGELTGALGSSRDGVAELVIGARAPT